MNKVYVLFVKNRGEGGFYLPDYEVHYDPVQGKVAELNPGECVDTYKCSLSEDGTYVKAELFKVSNIDGKAQEEFTESFLIDRCSP